MSAPSGLSMVAETEWVARSMTDTPCAPLGWLTYSRAPVGETAVSAGSCDRPTPLAHRLGGRPVPSPHPRLGHWAARGHRLMVLAYALFFLAYAVILDL